VVNDLRGASLAIGIRALRWVAARHPVWVSAVFPDAPWRRRRLSAEWPLIWADTRWWVGQFQAAGFRRQTDIEAALHQKYDDYLSMQSPARRSFYVFSLGDCGSSELIRRILAFCCSDRVAALRTLGSLGVWGVA
jgi:hypothetical protein